MTNKTVYKFILDIMNPEIKSDIVRVREVIFLAEDTSFSREQSKVISEWLLGFALKNRNNPDNIDAVYSAIRTGASMLFPESVKCLLPLLEDDGVFNVSRVTVKMIGRIFEAQPPSEIGQYEYMAKRVFNIVDSILDGSELSSGDGAMAELGITSLAAMGSETVFQILKKLKNQEQWFKNYVLHNLSELKIAWSDNASRMASWGMSEFLNGVIEFLENIINE